MTAPAGYLIRPARDTDRAAIAAFTDHTFAWGDYIVDVWEKWLADTTGMLFVAVEEATDEPIALVHATLPAPREAWLEGARVHPLHRRRGLADALNGAALAWAAGCGARVARLGTEATNEPAARQVSRMGYEAVASFVYAWADPGVAVRRQVEHEGPERPSTRSTFPADRDDVRLATAPDAATVARQWRAREAPASAGGLAGRNWAWRRFGEYELLEALRAGRVLMHPTGIGVLDLGSAPAELTWLDGEGAREVARAAVQAAWAVRAERLLALVPASGANNTALAGAGFDDPVRMSIYELPLPVVA
jgi:ribosomal protein S18 acetylase RimI-like enzyme